MTTILGFPIPTTGGAICCSPDIWPWGPLDQRRLKRVRMYWCIPRLLYAMDIEVDRACAHGDVCVDERARHRLYGEAGGRFSQTVMRRF